MTAYRRRARGYTWLAVVYGFLASLCVGLVVSGASWLWGLSAVFLFVAALLNMGTAGANHRMADLHREG